MEDCKAQRPRKANEIVQPKDLAVPTIRQKGRLVGGLSPVALFIPLTFINKSSNNGSIPNGGILKKLRKV